MLADSVTEPQRRVLVEVTDNDSTTSGQHGDGSGPRRCTLIRASSELGVHHRADVSTERTHSVEDHPTPPQVTYLLPPKLSDRRTLK